MSSTRQRIAQISTFTRDEYIELAEGLLTVANQLLGHPCRTELRCLTQNWQFGDGSSCSEALSPEITRNLNEGVTRARYEEIRAITSADLKQNGLIQLDIRPASESPDLCAAWACMRTAGKKNIAEFYIQGPGVGDEALKPVVNAWYRMPASAAGDRLPIRTPKWLANAISRLMQ